MENQSIMKIKAKPILIVEDDPDDAEMSRRALRASNIWNEIVVAQTGKEALDYLFAQGKYADRDIDNLPDFILLDIRLPGISGIEVLKRIRADERMKSLPVVVFSGSANDEELSLARQLGAKAAMRKPTDLTEFINAVAQIGLRWVVFK